MRNYISAVLITIALSCCLTAFGMDTSQKTILQLHSKPGFDLGTTIDLEFPTGTAYPVGTITTSAIISITTGGNENNADSNGAVILACSNGTSEVLHVPSGGTFAVTLPTTIGAYNYVAIFNVNDGNGNYTRISSNTITINVFELSTTTPDIDMSAPDSTGAATASVVTEINFTPPLTMEQINQIEFDIEDNTDISSPIIVGYDDGTRYVSNPSSQMIALGSPLGVIAAASPRIALGDTYTPYYHPDQEVNYTGIKLKVSATSVGWFSTTSTDYITWCWKAATNHQRQRIVTLWRHATLLGAVIVGDQAVLPDNENGTFSMLQANRRDNPDDDWMISFKYQGFTHGQGHIDSCYRDQWGFQTDLSSSTVDNINTPTIGQTTPAYLPVAGTMFPTVDSVHAGTEQLLQGQVIISLNDSVSIAVDTVPLKIVREYDVLPTKSTATAVSPVHEPYYCDNVTTENIGVTNGYQDELSTTVGWSLSVQHGTTHGTELEDNFAKAFSARVTNSSTLMVGGSISGSTAATTIVIQSINCQNSNFRSLAHFSGKYWKDYYYDAVEYNLTGNPEYKFSFIAATTGFKEL